MIGIASVRCFEGNVSLLAGCDVIIATENSNIGMGGPAMIEGGGLGVFAPEDIGPMEIQVPNGVVDLAVKDEAEAVRVAQWEAHDQRRMRRIIPENRLRVYHVRDVVETLADAGSGLEIREDFGRGMVTALLSVEGRPLGVVANNPMHLGGAIDSDGADKAARFLQLCDAFDLPVLFLCDTPGIMVGPEMEKTAPVRHSNRLFLVGANLDVTYMTVILRKAYGLGAIAMAGGSYKEPAFTVSWPTGEFGGMGLEGSVKLGFRDNLAAIGDPEERRRKYEEMVAQAYETGKALHQASLFGVDDAIDPAETRTWVANTVRAEKPMVRTGKKRAFVDGWEAGAWLWGFGNRRTRRGVGNERNIRPRSCVSCLRTPPPTSSPLPGAYTRGTQYPGREVIMKSAAVELVLVLFISMISGYAHSDYSPANVESRKIDHWIEGICIQIEEYVFDPKQGQDLTVRYTVVEGDKKMLYLDTLYPSHSPRRKDGFPATGCNAYSIMEDVGGSGMGIATRSVERLVHAVVRRTSTCLGTS